MKLYEMSAYGISAQDFFEELMANGTDAVVDVRLRNTSQLSGFTKKRDLEYLIPQITGARYVHDARFLPTQELLEGYLRQGSSWDAYRRGYRALMEQRDAAEGFFRDYGPHVSVCVLGAARGGRKSHSEEFIRILEEYYGNTDEKH